MNSNKTAIVRPTAQYTKCVAAALAETTSLKDLARALADEIPARPEGGQTAGLPVVTDLLEQVRIAISDAGGEPKAVRTLQEYRATALWASDGWVAGESYSSHEEARKLGISYDAFALKPETEKLRARRLRDGVSSIQLFDPEADNDAALRNSREALIVEAERAKLAEERAALEEERGFYRAVAEMRAGLRKPIADPDNPFEEEERKMTRAFVKMVDAQDADNLAAFTDALNDYLLADHWLLRYETALLDNLMGHVEKGRKELVEPTQGWIDRIERHVNLQRNRAVGEGTSTFPFLARIEALPFLPGSEAHRGYVKMKELEAEEAAARETAQIRIENNRSRMFGRG